MTRATKITTRSRRSLDAACERAGVPFPTAIRDFGPVYLHLLVAGVDHVHVGRPTWFDSICRDAPPEGSVRQTTP